MKIYARQIEPEYQDSRIFDDDGMGPDYINVYGNKDYVERTSALFDRVRECLDSGELAEDLEAVADKSSYAAYGSATEAIENQLWRDDGKRYGPRQIGELRKLVLRYSECRSGEEAQILTDVLSIVTGEKWACREISGDCQGDWNMVYYPVQYWTADSLDAFEVMYFNTGTEWTIHDGENAPESAEDVEGYGCYCVAWDDDGIKAEIAAIAGGNPEDVVLYKYAGSRSVPVYEVA